jgi:aryl-alcohol dehydrogenase-like predicted oxidoreductase
MELSHIFVVRSREACGIWSTTNRPLPTSPLDPATPIEETMRVFRAPQEEGKIRHVGLSEVSIEDIERAGSVVEIGTVQNVYNVATRVHEDVLTYCERNNIAFIPFGHCMAGR